MSFINATSSTNSTSSTSSASYNGRYWGLASGLDVDNIVTALVSDEQAKIDKAGQQKQSLQWKQTAYQDVISKLNTFSQTYLSYSGSGNILSSDVYNAYNPVSDNNLISVAANSDAVAGDHSITVTQSAVAGRLTGSAVGTSISGAQAVTADMLKGTSFNVTIDGLTKTVSFLTTDPYGTTPGDIASLVQNKINTAFGINKAQVQADASGKLTITSDPAYQSVIRVTAQSSIQNTTDLSKFTTDNVRSLFSGTNFNMTVNGVTKNISFSSSDFDTGFTGIGALIQSKVNDAFGTGVVDVTQGLSNGKVTIQSHGFSAPSITLTNSGVSTSTLAVLGITSGTSISSSLTAMGINSGVSNRLDTSASLSTLFGNAITADSNGNFNVSINGTAIALNTSMSLSSVLTAINSSQAGVTASYSTTQGKILMTSNTTGASTAIACSDNASGSSNGFFNAIFGGTPASVTGRDAIFSVDNVAMTRSTNQFTVEGVTYSINGTIDSSQTAHFNLTADPSGTVKTLSAFVKDYNSLIDSLTAYITDKPDVNYQPLTDAQKSTMTSDQINQWNTKAQQGILFDDDTIGSILSQLQSLIYQPVTTSTGKSISLYQIGITTSDDYESSGKLNIDSSKLTAALQSDPGAVRDLFTQTSSINYQIASKTQAQRFTQEGLANRISDLIQNATTKGVYPYVGSLIAIAGDAGSTSTDYEINKQLADLTTQISDEKTQMTDKKNQLYAKFTKLETMMQQMNSQSSMLSQMGGGS